MQAFRLLTSVPPRELQSPACRAILAVVYPACPTARLLTLLPSLTRRRDKERKQADAAEGSSPPRSRLAEAAAEFNEAQQAFLLSSPSGLGVGAEAAIAQAIKDGALDNLAGKGKPAGGGGGGGGGGGVAGVLPWGGEAVVQAVTGEKCLAGCSQGLG